MRLSEIIKTIPPEEVQPERYDDYVSIVKCPRCGREYIFGESKPETPISGYGYARDRALRLALRIRYGVTLAEEFGEDRVRDVVEKVAGESGRCWLCCTWAGMSPLVARLVEMKLREEAE